MGFIKRSFSQLHVTDNEKCEVTFLSFPSLYKGLVVVQLVEALHYKPEGSRFDSRWCHWNFSLTYSFRLHYGPGVDSASNRNEYQEYCLGVGAASA